MQFFCCCETDTCHGGGVKLAEIQAAKEIEAAKIEANKEIKLAELGQLASDQKESFLDFQFSSIKMRPRLPQRDGILISKRPLKFLEFNQSYWLIRVV